MNFIDVIIQFCVSITCIMFVLVCFEDLINSGGILFKFITTIIFGIGGIGIYIILGSKLKECQLKLENKRSSK